MCVCVYVCIYIYICVYIYIGERALGAGPAAEGGQGLGARYYTPEIAKVKFRWKVPLNIHWRFPVQTHWESDNPFEHTAEK